MTKVESEEMVAKALMTEEGKQALRPIIEEAGAIFADMYPEGSFGYHLGRAVAGLPPKGLK